MKEVRPLNLDPKEVLIMGVLNATPDSFSDGGKFNSPDKALERAKEMEAEGADIIDVGGESSRPGAETVPEGEELERTIPVIKKIKKESNLPISIDTYKANVAQRALEEGAEIVNDISALRFDPEMAEVVAEKGANVILMHMQGRPQNMQENPTYEDVVEDIFNFLKARINYAQENGISADKIIIDPGIGFGKTVEDNFRILQNLEKFKRLEKPLLLGTSRKSFIGKALNTPLGERLEGTIASNVVGIMKGANILRVHDVNAIKRAADITIRCNKPVGS